MTIAFVVSVCRLFDSCVQANNIADNIQGSKTGAGHPVRLPLPRVRSVRIQLSVANLLVYKSKV